MSDPKISELKPPPLAADLVDALDADRLDYAADALAKASRFAAGASFAAEAGDIAELAIRSRQAFIALKEACSRSRRTRPAGGGRYDRDLRPLWPHQERALLELRASLGRGNAGGRCCRRRPASARR